MKENKVANLLIKLRKDNGFTQSDLADRLDVTFQAVSKWERGENLPDAYTLIELAKIYGITVDEILNGKVIYKELEEVEKIPTTGLYMILTTGIVFVVGSPLWLFIVAQGSTLGLVLMFLMMITGIGAIIFSGIKLDDIEKKNGDKKELSKKQAAIYGVAFVIFFFSGATWGVWGISWLAFVIAWIIISVTDKEDK